MRRAWLAMALIGCSDELPNDRGVWYLCNVGISVDTGSGSGDLTGGAGLQLRVCGNPGLPAGDVNGACIDQCEDDLGGFCFGLGYDSGSDEFELFECGPDCFANGTPIQTGESCADGSIVPGPPALAQADVTLDPTARFVLDVDDESSGEVLAQGALKYTAVPCDTAPCPFHLAAFRFTTPDFEIADVPITGVLVQSAGLAVGTIDAAGNFTLPPGQVRASVNFHADGDRGSITLTNAAPMTGHANPNADTFTINGQFSQDEVSVSLMLSGFHTNLPPVADFTPRADVECTGPQGAQVTLDASPSTDPEGEADIGFFRWRARGVNLGSGPQVSTLLPFGASTVGLGVVDRQLARDALVRTLTVVDTTPPTVTAPPDLAVECTSPGGTPVALGTATAADVCDATLALSNDAPAAFSLGATTVTWSSTDDASNTGTDTQEVRVADTTPPALAVTVTPAVLWPPNHALVPIEARIDVRDVCDANPTVRLVSIVSNEPDDARGDGHTAPDVQGAALGADDRGFLLRAERSGPGAGRVYTITYEARDASGNTTRTQATVTVPKSRGR